MKKNVNGNNLKTKIISLVTAVALWLYVIAVVDPEEKKVIENIPITITNSSEVLRDDFVIYPHEDFRTDVTVQGKLSEIQKLNKNNVHVYGELINPVEGQNIINLRTNISNRVSRDLKDNTLVVDLEKKINKEVPIKIKVPDAMKNAVESVKPDLEEIEVSGPRSLIGKVDYVGAVLNFNEDRSKPEAVVELRLAAYSKDGTPIDVTIEKNTVKVTVRFTVEKTVPVKIDYEGENLEREGIQINPDKLTIMGDEDSIRNIDSILTEKITEKDVASLDTKKLKIVIPSNVRIKNGVSEVLLSRTNLKN